MDIAQNYQLLDEEVFAGWMMKLFATEHLGGSQFRRVFINAVKENYQDPEADIVTFADYCGVDVDTIKMKMEESFTLTAEGFLKEYRLQMAAMLLSQGMDISIVKAKTGFSDVKTLRDCYVARFG